MFNIWVQPRADLPLDGVKQSSLPYLYHSLYSQDWHFVSKTIIFLYRRIYVRTYEKILIAGKSKQGILKRPSTLKVSSSPESCFLLPTSTQSQSDGAQPAWPGCGHTWAPIPATWALSGTSKTQEYVHYLQWWLVPQCSKGIKPLGISPS